MRHSRGKTYSELLRTLLSNYLSLNSAGKIQLLFVASLCCISCYSGRGTIAEMRRDPGLDSLHTVNREHVPYLDRLRAQICSFWLQLRFGYYLVDVRLQFSNLNYL